MVQIYDLRPGHSSPEGNQTSPHSPTEQWDYHQVSGKAAKPRGLCTETLYCVPLQSLSGSSPSAHGSLNTSQELLLRVPSFKVSLSGPMNKFGFPYLEGSSQRRLGAEASSFLLRRTHLQEKVSQRVALQILLHALCPSSHPTLPQRPLSMLLSMETLTVKFSMGKGLLSCYHAWFQLPPNNFPVPAHRLGV